VWYPVGVNAYRQSTVEKNRTSTVGWALNSAGAAQTFIGNINGLVYLLAGDYVEVTAYAQANGQTAQLLSFTIVAITPESVT